MNNTKLCRVNLTLFGEDAALVGEMAQTADVGQPPETGSEISGDYENVPIGTQDAAVNAPENDRRAEYKRLIDEEYKDLYVEDTQKMINKRFRETKQLKEQLDTYEPVIQTLYARYGEQSMDKLTEAIHNDKAQATSADADITAEENRILRGWYRESAEVCARYPDFDFMRETRNPLFTSMLKGRIPMEVAYRAIHHNEILSGATRQAAEEAARNTAANVQARGARVSENGTSSTSGVIVKSDVSRLTKADRAEAARRAARGENISF